MSLIALRGARLGYRGVTVLEDVELAVDAGDVLVVAGANGSGKSTLLRALLGVAPPLAGQRVLRPALRLGFVPQQAGLDPAFPASARDVVAMGTWRRGVRRRGEGAVRAALAAVEMAHRSKARFGLLSGGQKQRVLLARALAGRPELLLLDEPLSGLDERATGVILGALTTLRAAGTGIVMVTHRPPALRRLATAACLVAGGRVRPVAVEELCSAEGMAAIWG